jgi:hypothetical protein
MSVSDCECDGDSLEAKVGCFHEAALFRSKVLLIQTTKDPDLLRHSNVTTLIKRVSKDSTGGGEAAGSQQA